MVTHEVRRVAGACHKANPVCLPRVSKVSPGFGLVNERLRDSPTENAYASNAKIRFQSLFMLITGHPFAFASLYSAGVNVPTLLSGNPMAGP